MKRIDRPPIYMKLPYLVTEAPFMRCHVVFASLLFALIPIKSALSAENSENFFERRDVLTLPKVPVRIAIMKDGEKDPARLSEWIRTFIEAKEKKANVELEEMKKKVRAEEETRLTAEKERRRRQEKYDQSFGTVGSGAGNKAKRAPLHMKLDFQVLEIDSYRAIADAQRSMQAIANDIAQNLSSLDRDGDGKLSTDEYRDAGAVVIATKRLFQSIDSNGDGMISEDELESARKISPSMSAAVRAGREGAMVANFKIKPFDTDANGVLDVDERKALTTAFVELSVRLGQEADFYKTLADNLSKAREIVAARFADIEIAP